MHPQSSANYAELLVNALQAWPDRVAFDDMTNQFTYRHCSNVVAQISAALRRTGDIRGRGFGVLSVNAAESWLVVAAVKIGGGYVTQLPTRGSPEDLAFFLNNGDISTLIVHPELVDLGNLLLPRCPGVRTTFSLGASAFAPDLLALAAKEGSVSLRPDPDIKLDDIIEIKFTGGTTGISKGANHTQRSNVAHALAYIYGPHLPYGSRYLASSPMSHSGYVFIAPTLYVGGTVVINPMFDPDLFIDTVQRKRITTTMAVPTMIYKLLDIANQRDVDLSSIQRFIYGAAPMSPSRLAEAKERFGFDDVFAQVYGVVECLGIATMLPPGLHDPSRPDLLASCGLAVGGVSATLLDEEGNAVPDGQTGEICVRSEAVMEGYRNMPEETADAFRFGWLHTGDLATRSPEGLFTIVDRKKDVIISGGFNVFSSQVEGVIASDPRVGMVAVIGVPDPIWGEAVKAIVLPIAGATITEAEIKALVRAEKGPVCTPKSVEFVAELPTTRLGKIDKVSLRDGYWKGQPRKVG